MGSNPWVVAVPYQADVVGALSRAQDEVLARREYGFANAMRVFMRFCGQEIPEALQEPLRLYPELPPARSIDEARQYAGESGTNSVLDVYRIGPRPGFFTAGPFATEFLVESCGSATPSRAEVVSSLGALLEPLNRGEAAFVVCHDSTGPTEYVFLGMSVD
jgi:hypothetical protein